MKPTVDETLRLLIARHAFGYEDTPLGRVYNYPTYATLLALATAAYNMGREAGIEEAAKIFDGVWLLESSRNALNALKEKEE